MENIIFTIAQEAKGGREIGTRLAKELNISFYEKEIIKLAAASSNISEDIFYSVENLKLSYLNCSLLVDFSLGISFHSSPNFIPIQDKVFIEKNNIVTKLSEKESCVIFCKYANYMLRDNTKCIKVLIYSSDNDILKDTKNKYMASDKKCKKIINKKNKILARYYNYYTGGIWDNKKGYDILINSSTLSVTSCVKILKEIYYNNFK